MTTRVFFYGLYMDAVLLESLGFRLVVVGAAQVDGYRLRIGERATLVPAEGKTCYGFLIELSDEEVSALFSLPEVGGYVPQQVTVTLLADSTMHKATSYVLTSDEAGSNTNREYAESLLPSCCAWACMRSTRASGGGDLLDHRSSTGNQTRGPLTLRPHSA